LSSPASPVSYHLPGCRACPLANRLWIDGFAGSFDASGINSDGDALANPCGAGNLQRADDL